MEAEDITRARSWIQQCISKHASCRTRARLSTIWSSDNMHIVRDLGHDDMMPKRLLRFSTDISDNSVIKLVENHDASTHQLQPYVALSHCWGDSESLKTTSSNLGSVKEGIRLAELPKLYRDVVVASANLGYEYLWVDALCIVQDDVEDWKSEAPRMAVVYGNAEISIAAMDAKDSADDLFRRGEDDDGAELGGLSTRAWALQEQMISPRSLLCARGRVSWECREADARHGEWELRKRGQAGKSEPDKKNDEMLIPDNQKELFAFFRDFRVSGLDFDEDQHEFIAINSDLGGERDDYEPLLRAWWKLITAYSPRLLTYGKDKFLALNGIAGVVQRWTQLKNTFGLWYHFIEHELLWYVDPAGPRATKPSTFRTPSWSWANMDGGLVRNAYYDRLPAVPVLMIKPTIGMPVGTSFDQELPIPSWSRQHYSLSVSGDLRAAEITARLDSVGTRKYDIEIDPVGRSSNEEIHLFFPDAEAQFPVDRPVKVLCLHMLHYEKDGKQFPRYIDVRLILAQLHGAQELKLYEEDVPESELQQERTMCRVGYMETTFDDMRDVNDIWEDRWWRHLVLL